MCDNITLYPSNWLFNAGVIGMLDLLDSIGKNVENYFENGTIKTILLIDSFKEIMGEKKQENFPEPFNQIPVWHWFYCKKGFESKYGTLSDFIHNNLSSVNAGNKAQKKEQLKIKNQLRYLNFNDDFSIVNNTIDNVFTNVFKRLPTLSIDEGYNLILNSLNDPKLKILYIYRKFVGAFFSKGCIYLNLFNPNYYNVYEKFINQFSPEKFLIANTNENNNCSFCNTNYWELEPLSDLFMSKLFPGFNSFPNAFWNNNQNNVTHICSFCKLIVLHHHLSFIKLSDFTEIFINAPSFKIMFELNNIMKNLYNFNGKENLRSKREILATSIIEYTRKLQANLGIWSGMNLEIVTKSKDGVDFFSLPDDIMKIISDRKIASILSDLGEFKILNKVLDRKNSDLIEIGYKLLKLSTKRRKDRNNNDKSVISSLLSRLENQNKITSTANKILKLYSLIEEKNKRSK